MLRALIHIDRLMAGNKGMKFQEIPLFIEKKAFKFLCCSKRGTARSVHKLFYCIDVNQFTDILCVCVRNEEKKVVSGTTNRNVDNIELIKEHLITV